MGKIAIITGSGLEGQNPFKDNTNVLLIERHGEGHCIMPSNVNYLSNILSCRDFGAELIIGVTAVGSLREELKPGMIVLPSQFIDWTFRKKTYFSDGDFNHTEMAHPFAVELFPSLIHIMNRSHIKYSFDETIISINGPRFSTKAESLMFRGFGADLINMVTSSECTIANELQIPYVAMAMVTDYDAWKDGENVTMDQIKKIMEENSGNIIDVLKDYIKVL